MIALKSSAGILSKMKNIPGGNSENPPSQNVLPAKSDCLPLLNSIHKHGRLPDDHFMFQNSYNKAIKLNTGGNKL